MAVANSNRSMHLSFLFGVGSLVSRFLKISVLDVVALESVLEEHSAFVEQSQGDDCLGNADTLTTEDSAQSKLSTVMDHFLDGCANSNRLARDFARLHDNFQTTERIGDDNVNWTDNGRSDKTGQRSSHVGLISELFLNVLLKTRLSNESQSSTGQGMAHQWNGTTEQGTKLLSRRFLQDFANWLCRACLLEISTLLFLNHANWVDEGG